MLFVNSFPHQIKKGIVERDVVRVITPGTLLDENTLDKKENNYIVSILISNEKIALAAADLSTGYFATTEYDLTEMNKVLQDELSTLQPSECILPESLYNDTSFLKQIKREKKVNIFSYSNFEVHASQAQSSLQKQFGVKTLDSFAISDKKIALQAAAALLGYLKETQKGNVSHIKKIVPLSQKDGLMLDRSTIINLELFSTIREHDTRGSLLSILDHTQTAMGGRLLKQWMKKPLTDKVLIEDRLHAVEYLKDNPNLRGKLRAHLNQIPDIERLLSRLAVNLGNARDLVNLKQALVTTMLIKHMLRGSNSSLLNQEVKNIKDKLQNIINIIEKVIVDEPPIAIREGRMIKKRS